MSLVNALLTPKKIKTPTFHRNHPRTISHYKQSSVLFARSTISKIIALCAAVWAFHTVPILVDICFTRTRKTQIRIIKAIKTPSLMTRLTSAIDSNPIPNNFTPRTFGIIITTPSTKLILTWRTCIIFINSNTKILRTTFTFFVIV